jgi:excisionase family DNA binding protein
MTELSDHYMRVRDYARKFSLDESTVYKMIERGEIKAPRLLCRCLA